MPNIKDERGFNQVFKPTGALDIRTKRRLSRILEKFLPVEEGQSILEIGCGRGQMAFLMASCTKAEVHAVDISQEFIANARRTYQLPNLEFEIMDFNQVSGVEAKKTDFIFGNGILHHFYYQLDSILAKIALMLKPHGKIAFWEPNIQNPYCQLIFNYSMLRKMAHLEPGEMAIKKSWMEKKLRDAGFKDISIEYRDFLLPNTPAYLIRTVVLFGAAMEKTPVLKNLSQSLFIYAGK